MPVELTKGCQCPPESEIQALARLNNNLVTLFTAMAASFVGRRVSVIGQSACGCTPAQILQAINDNIVEFGLAYTGGGSGGPDTIGSTTNNSGNSDITADSDHHIEIITLGGSAGTRIFPLLVAGVNEGARLYLRFVTPATAGIVVEVRDATTGGTLLYTYTTDGSGLDIAFFDLYFDGAAWKALDNAVPFV